MFDRLYQDNQLEQVTTKKGLSNCSIASLCSELVAKMAKDIGMTIRKGIVVPFLPCLVAFWGFHPYMFFHFFKCFFVTCRNVGRLLAMYIKAIRDMHLLPSLRYPEQFSDGSGYPRLPFTYDHTMLNTPVLVRSLKLSSEQCWTCSVLGWVRQFSSDH